MFCSILIFLKFILMVLFNISHRLCSLQFLHETGLNFHFFCCWCQFLREMVFVLNIWRRQEAQIRTQDWRRPEQRSPLFCFYMQEHSLYLVKGLVMHHNTFLCFSFIQTENTEVCGTDCPGEWWNHHPWKCSKNKEVWCLGTGCSGGLSSVGSMIGLNDLGSLFQI